MDITIDSRVYPRIYLQGPIGEKFFYLFIKKIGIMRSINHQVSSKILSHFRHKDEQLNKDATTWGIKYEPIVIKIYEQSIYNIFEITDEVTLYNIYLYGLQSHLITVLSITEQPPFYFEKSINPNIDKYWEKYYVRTESPSDLSIVNKVKYQVKRIDEYGKIMKQLFKFRCGLFKTVDENLVNKIFSKLKRIEPNLAFCYINPFMGDDFYEYIKNDEMYIEANNDDDYEDNPYLPSDEDDFYPYDEESDEEIEKFDPYGYEYLDYSD